MSTPLHATEQAKNETTRSNDGYQAFSPALHTLGRHSRTGREAELATLIFLVFYLARR